jgi:transposase
VHNAAVNFTCSDELNAVSYLEMNHSDIEKILVQASEVTGSASVERLSEMLAQLIIVVQALLDESKRKDHELHQLRTAQYGSKPETLRRAEDFVDGASEAAPPSDDPVEEPAAAAVHESAAEIAAKKAQAKALLAEARRLEGKARGKKPGDKKQPPIEVEPHEIVRHLIPTDREIICLLCLEPVRDQGKSHEAMEIDVADTQLIKRLHLLHQGSCPCGSLVFTMPSPIRGVEQTVFSPRFVAQIVYNKFVMHLPLYRQAKDLVTGGIAVTRGRLSRLILGAYANVGPLIRRIEEINRFEAYQQCDESPITMVIEGEREKHFLWCLVTSKAVTYTITEERNKDVARDVIGGATPGALVTDRLSIYSKLFDNKEESACMAHLRRKFWYALPNFPNESISVLRLIGDLYDIEREVSGLSPADRLIARKKRSTSILIQIQAAFRAMNPPPRSALGKAIAYGQKHWKALTYFARDGGVPIDNNKSESALRAPKLGWKNFLFCQSDLGGEAVAGMYTLATTCALHGIELKSYLSDVITKLNSGYPAKQLDDLLPWNWKPNLPLKPKAPLRTVAHHTVDNVIHLARINKKIANLKARAQ